MIELNQSWSGPYHRMPLARWMLVHPITGIVEEKPDPYPPDVLAACPMAREWGVRLHDNLGTDFPYAWRCGKYQWYWTLKSWNVPSEKDIGVRRTRELALKNAPTTPPPGYVAAKPKAKPLLDELAEVAYEADKIEGSGPWSSLSDKGRESWRRKALAVARRLLEREPSEGEVSEACDAYLMFKEPERSVVVNLRRMEDALKASRRAQLAELEGEVPT